MFNEKIKDKISAFFFMLAISGPPRPRFNNASSIIENNFDSSIYFEVICWVIITIYVIKFYLRNYKLLNNNFLFSNSSLKYYFLFSILALFSTIYSFIPLLTLYSSIKFIILFLLANIVIYKNNYDIWILIKILIYTSIVIFLVQIFFLIVDPYIVGVYYKDGSYRFTGGFLAVFSYGLTGLFALIFVYLKIKKSRNKKFYLMIFPLVIYLIYLSKTRQTFLLFFILITLLYFNDFRPKIFPKFFITILFIVSIISVIYFTDLYQLGLLFVRDYESLETMSGRTIVMEKMIEISKDLFPFGGGFIAGSRYFLIKTGFSEMGIGNAHESISTILIETGILGVILLSILLLKLFKEIKILFYLLRKNRDYQDFNRLLIIVLSLSIYSILTIISHPSFAQGGALWVILLFTIQLIKMKKYYEKSYPYR